jgi:hypothetical protein
VMGTSHPTRSAPSFRNGTNLIEFVPSRTIWKPVPATDWRKIRQPLP